MQPPKIEFPCEYPISVVGESAEDFHALVVDIVERHAPGFARERITLVPSRGGKYLSVRVVIEASGEAQLQALFAELKGTGRVHAVL